MQAQEDQVWCRKCEGHFVVRWSPGVAVKCPGCGTRYEDEEAPAGRAGTTVGKPTQALPGTPEKVAVMERRARLKQRLDHPRDAGVELDRALQMLAGQKNNKPQVECVKEEKFLGIDGVLQICNTKESLGTRVKLLRERKGLTLRELARRAGLEPSTVMRLERNLHKPRLDNLQAVAQVLEVPLQTLAQGRG